MSSPVVIILAAGRGERFLASGGKTHKLEAVLAGQSVLTHVIQAVEAANLPWHLVRPEGGTPGMGRVDFTGRPGHRPGVGMVNPARRPAFNSAPDVAARR